jgi:hypothetical protein
MRPAIILSNVVLPAPVGPKNIKYSLSLISKEMLSRALKFRKDLEIFFNLIFTIRNSPILVLC